MRSLIIIVLAGMLHSCGTIEDSQHIPSTGTYRSESDSMGYVNLLTISKIDKGYDITFTEYSDNGNKENCIISASGEKSGYGIWVELPAFGPRLPVIIRKRNEVIEISLKGPDDPRKSFTFCQTNRTPAGIYHKK